MTTPVAPESTPQPVRQPRPTSFLDWFQVNSRWVTLGAVAVAIAGGVAWYIPRAKAMKNERADKALVAAKVSLQQGNQPLAESDLKKVAEKYAGTASGTEAALMLAQLQIQKGDTDGAIAHLKDLAGKLGSDPSGPGVRSLLGDAYLQANKPADAAAEYQKAADQTSLENEKATLLSKAGTALVLAGKVAEARKVYEVLAASSSNEALAAEARVRLGELSVAGKS